MSREVLTIRESVQRAQAEGLPVSEYSLRRWIKAGELPVRMIGKKALVFYPTLVSFITCENGTGDNPKPATMEAGGIRRLGVG